MTPTIKKALSLIALISVCAYATDKWQFDYETGGSNFTKKQRWQTGALNIVPGVGSFFIMDDMTGAVVQWGLTGVGLAAMGIVIMFGEEQCDSHECKPNYEVAIKDYAVVGLLASYIYNIYRSITYDKPKKTALGEHDGFNVAVLPDRNGKLNAFLMFNKAF